MKNYFCCLLAAGIVFNSYAQVEKEITLTKDSKGKIPADFYLAPNGPEVSMQIKGTKENYRFENYSFNSELSDFKTQITESPILDMKKLQKKIYSDLKDYEITQYSMVAARVGGETSFTVLNQALYVRKKEVTKFHNKTTGGDFYKTRITEAIKLKDEVAGKFVAFSANNDYTTGNAIVLATTKDKPDDYQLLTVDTTLNIKSNMTGLSGPHTLVYECLLNEKGEEIEDFSKGTWYLLFAPKEGVGNPSTYTLLKVNNKAEVIERTEVAMPAPAVVVYNMTTDGKNVYITGGTFPKEKFYVFKPYRDIPMTYDGGLMYMQNYLQQQSGEECESLVVIKLNGQKTEWTSKTSIKDFKSLAKPSEGGKAIVYKGQFLKMSNACVAGNYFAITGQQVEFSLMGKFIFKYLNAYTFLIENTTGKVVAQYALKTQSQDDKYGVFFELPMILKPSGDGKKLHWVVFENEALKEETTDFHAFINGYSTFEYTACYYPTVSTIDLSSFNQSKYYLPGKGEYRSKNPLAYRIDLDNGFYYLGFQGKDKMLMYKYNY